MDIKRELLKLIKEYCGKTLTEEIQINFANDILADRVGFDD